jgi:phosphate transport system ATP-binding protein
VIDVDLKEIYYGHVKAVRDTKLHVKKGTITALIGPSGCGRARSCAPSTA